MSEQVRRTDQEPSHKETDRTPERPSPSPRAEFAERVSQSERRDAAEAQRVREEIANSSGGAVPMRPEHLYGAFRGDVDASGAITLPESVQRAVEVSAEQFRRGAKLMTNTVTGEPIAAEYDIKTNNFSTQTRIAELPDGRKVFIVYDHVGSTVHRWLDHLMKWASGLRMHKVSRREWKHQFETKSIIPTIQNADPNTVIMPFLPNVNAYDVFANNATIEDFGSCAWAKGMDADGKMELAGTIVDEVKRIHGQGTAWGELILPNVIFTEEQKPIICDPEVRYDDDVSLAAAKACDLKDILLSVTGALRNAHGAEDPAPMIVMLLDRYGDDEVIAALQEIAGKKQTLLQRLAFGYELVRSGGVNREHYDRVLASIRSYRREAGPVSRGTR